MYRGTGPTDLCLVVSDSDWRGLSAGPEGGSMLPQIEPQVTNTDGVYSSACMCTCLVPSLDAFVSLAVCVCVQVSL